jgi:hypothetical protein
MFIFKIQCIISNNSKKWIYRIGRIKRGLDDLSMEVGGREGGGVSAGVAVVNAVERHRNVVGRLKNKKI